MGLDIDVAGWRSMGWIQWLFWLPPKKHPTNSDAWS